ncbi:hypothetical protein [Comamonas testosteroni]|uniref:hypothetical protein n=1 Tax=Comamonas testosteroni TaxID=285 RepID=UPI002E103E5F|nr:hypothetical protein U0024_11905 [Comamonas testosteroni]
MNDDSAVGADELALADAAAATAFFGVGGLSGGRLWRRCSVLRPTTALRAR